MSGRNPPSYLFHMQYQIHIAVVPISIPTVMYCTREHENNIGRGGEEADRKKNKSLTFKMMLVVRLSTGIDYQVQNTTNNY